MLSFGQTVLEKLDYHGHSLRGYYSLVPNRIYHKLPGHYKQKLACVLPYETNHYQGRL